MIVSVLHHTALRELKLGDALTGRVDGVRQDVMVSDRDLSSGSHLPDGLGRRIDRFCSLALLAAAELAPAVPERDPSRIGVYVANVYAGWNYGEPQLANLVEIGPAAVHPYLATAWFPAAAQGEISIAFGWHGASKTFSGHGSAIAEAMLAAVLSIRLGRLDAALVIAAESCLSDFLLWGAKLRSSDPLISEGVLGVLLSTQDGSKGIPLCVLDVCLCPGSGPFKSHLYGQPEPIGSIRELGLVFDEYARGSRANASIPLSGGGAVLLGPAETV